MTVPRALVARGCRDHMVYTKTEQKGLMAMTSLKRLIAEDDVTADAVMKGSVPKGWIPPDSNPWEVTLTRKGATLTVPFYTGPAITDEPSAQDVLDCLLSDASSGEQSFEDFASDFGYDTDSRQAYATWEACQATGPKLREFLGDAYDDYMHSDR